MCSITSRLGTATAGAQALMRTPVRVSFMSFLLCVIYSSSSCALMEAMLGSLNLQTIEKTATRRFKRGITFRSIKINEKAISTTNTSYFVYTLPCEQFLLACPMTQLLPHTTHTLLDT